MEKNPLEVENLGILWTFQFKNTNEALCHFSDFAETYAIFEFSDLAQNKLKNNPLEVGYLKKIPKAQPVETFFNDVRNFKERPFF